MSRSPSHCPILRSEGRSHGSFKRARAQTSLLQNGKGYKFARVLKTTTLPPTRTMQACVTHTSTLCSSQTCASCHKRMIETLFRREHACEISHKRRFETLFKLGACLCTHHKRMFAARSTWQPCALNTSCAFATSADGMACVFITSAV